MDGAPRTGPAVTASLRVGPSGQIREWLTMSTHPFAAFCDDFYVNMRLGSQLQLPHTRETLLHFFERIQKNFPNLTRFRKNDNSEFNLEEDRNGPGYRWVSLESKRLTSGHVNPTTLEEAMRLHALLLDMAPHHLGLSPSRSTTSTCCSASTSPSAATTTRSSPRASSA